MRQTYNLFFEYGEVCEIRAIGGLSGKNKAWSGSCFGKKPTVAGYFDNADDFEKAAQALDEIGPEGIYFTVSPVIPGFLENGACFFHLCAVEFDFECERRPCILNRPHHSEAFCTGAIHSFTSGSLLGLCKWKSNNHSL